jgi:hypothetical protein
MPGHLQVEQDQVMMILAMGRVYEEARDVPREGLLAAAHAGAAARGRRCPRDRHNSWQDRQEPQVEVDLGCETGGRRNVRSEFLADLRVGQRREDARAPQHIAREGWEDAFEHRCGQRKLATHDQDEQFG